MASEQILPQSFVPVTAMKSFMSHFSHSPSPSPRPDQSGARPAPPLASPSVAAPIPSAPSSARLSDQRVIEETPGMSRAMAVAASEYPQLTYGGRRILVRAVVGLDEREVATPFEQRLRAAYFGRVPEAMPSGLINPTPMDWTALWLSMQPMHVFRAYVAEMLAAVRTLGAGSLSPEQTRLWSVYRKAQSEIGTERE